MASDNGDNLRRTDTYNNSADYDGRRNGYAGPVNGYDSNGKAYSFYRTDSSPDNAYDEEPQINLQHKLWRLLVESANAVVDKFFPSKTLSAEREFDPFLNLLVNDVRERCAESDLDKELVQEVEKEITNITDKKVKSLFFVTGGTLLGRLKPRAERLEILKRLNIDPTKAPEEPVDVVVRRGEVDEYQRFDDYPSFGSRQSGVDYAQPAGYAYGNGNYDSNTFGGNATRAFGYGGYGQNEVFREPSDDYDECADGLYYSENRANRIQDNLYGNASQESFGGFSAEIMDRGYDDSYSEADQYSQRRCDEQFRSRSFESQSEYSYSQDYDDAVAGSVAPSSSRSGYATNVSSVDYEIPTGKDVNGGKNYYVPAGNSYDNSEYDGNVEYRAVQQQSSSSTPRSSQGLRGYMKRNSVVPINTKIQKELQEVLNLFFEEKQVVGKYDLERLRLFMSLRIKDFDVEETNLQTFISYAGGVFNPGDNSISLISDPKENEGRYPSRGAFLTRISGEENSETERLLKLRAYDFIAKEFPYFVIIVPDGVERCYKEFEELPKSVVDALIKDAHGKICKIKPTFNDVYLEIAKKVLSDHFSEYRFQRDFSDFGAFKYRFKDYAGSELKLSDDEIRHWFIKADAPFVVEKEETDEESSDSAPVMSRVSVIRTVVAEAFPEGFRCNSLEDLKKFREAVKKYGMDFDDESERKLFKSIERHCVFFRGRWISAPEDSVAELKRIVKAQFKLGASIVFYESFYNRHEEELKRANITSLHLFQLFLVKLFPTFLFYPSYFEENPSEDHERAKIEHEILRVWNHDDPKSCLDLSQFMYVPQERILKVVELNTVRFRDMNSVDVHGEKLFNLNAGATGEPREDEWDDEYEKAFPEDASIFGEDYDDDTDETATANSKSLFDSEQEQLDMLATADAPVPCYDETDVDADVDAESTCGVSEKDEIETAISEDKPTSEEDSFDDLEMLAPASCKSALDGAEEPCDYLETAGASDSSFDESASSSTPLFDESNVADAEPVATAEAEFVVSDDDSDTADESGEDEEFEEEVDIEWTDEAISLIKKKVDEWFENGGLLIYVHALLEKCADDLVRMGFANVGVKALTFLLVTLYQDYYFDTDDAFDDEDEGWFFSPKEDDADVVDKIKAELDRAWPAEQAARRIVELFEITYLSKDALIGHIEELGVEKRSNGYLVRIPKRIEGVKRPRRVLKRKSGKK